MTALHLGTASSCEKRLLRAFLHREVAAGASLGVLIEGDHPAIQGVRAYQLVAWMPMVGPGRATRLVRGLPGHLPVSELTRGQLDLLLERVVRHEERACRHGVESMAWQGGRRVCRACAAAASARYRARRA